MKVSRFFTMLVLLGAALTFTSKGQAQMEPAYSLKGPLPACSGTYAIVRLAEIKPESNFEAYNKALEMHKAWFRKHGYKDQIFAARVLERDEKTGAAHFSNHMVLQYHFIDPESKPPVHDAEWDAYVKAYTDISTMKETYVSCVPKEHTPKSMK
ncbi:MAG: hypothetical protein WAL45_08860 [Terracidiphilus sp.]